MWRYEVQTSVKDRFVVGGDDIAALAQAPGDGVEEPDEEGQDAAEHEDAVDVAA